MVEYKVTDTVEPVSSISTAASSVGYVGNTNSALTAAKEATAVSGATPIASAAGIRAVVVAPESKAA